MAFHCFLILHITDGFSLFLNTAYNYVQLLEDQVILFSIVVHCTWRVRAIMKKVWCGS